MSQWSLTTELLMFDSLEAFQQDPSVCETAARLVMCACGTHEPQFYGKQIEYTTKGNIIADWDSYEDHEKVLNSPLFPVVKETLLKETIISWDTTVTYHTIFSARPIALERPITEVTVLTLKAPGNRQEVVEILTTISERTENMFVFGVEHDNDQKYLALCGWESVEAYNEAVSKPEVADILERLWSLADRNYHYLTQLSKVYRSDST
ncbi:hypothetical protein JVU11DRAFT_11632 [Chiua virens]|nr:hypothetical protein JVU11DRAFT_11632 [Chiua virens]